MRTMRPSWVQQMTIYLCHNAGMSASQLTEFFPVTKRRINQIISAFPDNFPGVWCAVEKCNEILERLPEECEEEDLEEDASLENLQFLEISPAIANDFFDSGGPNVENGLRTIKMNQIKRRLRRAKIRASRLEGIIRKSREFHEQFEELPSYDSRPTILDEFMELNAKNPQGRRYSEQVYRFAYNLMSYSERAYRYSRKLLPLPSRSQVMERFQTAHGHESEFNRSRTNASSDRSIPRVSPLSITATTLFDRDRCVCISLVSSKSCCPGDTETKTHTTATAKAGANTRR